MSELIPVVVGVDVGGTNTDAVVISSRHGDSQSVLAGVKRLTTSDVTTGVRNAVRSALVAACEKGHKVGVLRVHIGTTHFVNAVVQRRGLARVAVLRLCGTAARSLPPFSDCPEDLKQIICGSVHFLSGGYRYDGKPISEVQEAEVLAVLDSVREAGVSNLVVCGVSSPVRADQELQVAELIRKHHPDFSVTLSHTIGYMGILERENAAILNECLKPLCHAMIRGFQQTLDDLHLDCPMYLTQNDGTVIGADRAQDFPVYLFASGPTNSMRGAAYLTGLKDSLVVDVGGTTTDVGLLVRGFPRQAATDVFVAGLRTNFRMPDVLSIGLGGGSYVTSKDKAGGQGTEVKVGPVSAGYGLKEEAFVFAQSDEDLKNRKLTATDIAVASGLAKLGDPSRVASLDPDLVRRAQDEIHRLLDDAIDRVRVSDLPLPVVLVGGGSILIDRSRAVEGCERVLMPEYHGVANAIGAALSQVSGKADCVRRLNDLIDEEEMNNKIAEAVSSLPEESTARDRQLAEEDARRPYYTHARDIAVNDAIALAKEAAVKAGADPATLEVLESDEVALAYIPGNITRIKVKVMGDILQDPEQESKLKPWTPLPGEQAKGGEEEEEKKAAEAGRTKQTASSTGKSLHSDTVVTELSCDPSDPYIEEDTGMWVLSPWDVECLSVGTAILGAGGGGSAYNGRLKLLRALKEGKQIKVISPERLFRQKGDKDGVVVTVAWLGAPCILTEQLDGGTEFLQAIACMQEVLDRNCFQDCPDVDIKEKEGVRYVEDYRSARQGGGLGGEMGQGQRILGFLPAEIGGLNGMEPLLAAQALGLAVLDADGMGRAFPELHMFGPLIEGLTPYPVCIADDTGRQDVLLTSPSARMVEVHIRNTSVDMGCMAGVCLFPIPQAEVFKSCVLRSVSHAWRLGNAVLRARLRKASPVQAILDSEPSRMLLVGKIRDVTRETTGGFNKGRALLEGLDNYAGQRILIDFQNENLIARTVVGKSEDGGWRTGEVLACVPDLVVLVDSDTGYPIHTEEVRFGLRVAVLALGAPLLMRSPRALQVVGPQAFRYPRDVIYTPVGPPLETVPIPPL